MHGFEYMTLQILIIVISNLCKINYRTSEISRKQIQQFLVSSTAKTNIQQGSCLREFLS